MYENNNAKAIAFGKTHLRQVTAPAGRDLNEEYKSLAFEAAMIRPGKADPRNGQNNVDRLNRKMDRNLDKAGKVSAEHVGLTTAIEKLEQSDTLWSSLDEQDQLALKRHYRAEISRYTGTKTFLKD